MELMILAGVAVVLLIWVARRGLWLPESPISDIRVGLEGWNARGKIPGNQEEDLDRPWGSGSAPPRDPASPS